MSTRFPSVRYGLVPIACLVACGHTVVVDDPDGEGDDALASGDDATGSIGTEGDAPTEPSCDLPPGDLVGSGGACNTCSDIMWEPPIFSECPAGAQALATDIACCVCDVCADVCQAECASGVENTLDTWSRGTPCGDCFDAVRTADGACSPEMDACNW